MGVRSTGSHPTTTQADGHLLEYFRQNFDAGGGAAIPPPPPQGIQATGGVISDYAAPGPVVYRAHIFTASGQFTINELSTDPNLPDAIDCLVVGGGGGGGGAGPSYYGAGGGGAGGLLYNTNIATPATATYTITIGAGGAGGAVNQDPGAVGGQSSIAHANITNREAGGSGS